MDCLNFKRASPFNRILPKNTCTSCIVFIFFVLPLPLRVFRGIVASRGGHGEPRYQQHPPPLLRVSLLLSVTTPTTTYLPTYYI